MRRPEVIAVSLLILLPGIAFSQGESQGNASAPSVIVTLGKPNVWTMEQAHYLLEKNRAHDLGLAATQPDSLDANELVGYRLEAIKSLLTAQVQYDAVTGKKNTVAISQYNADMAHFDRLRSQLDGLRSRQAVLGDQLAAARYQLALTPSADTAKTQLLNAEITRIQSEQAAVDTETTSVSQAMGTEPTLGSLTSTLPTTDETNQSAIGPNSTFDTMLKGLPQGLNNSKLQASIKLDNYINLQYEIVAKQLTLLRDEAGPGKQVVFVELPQSIYVTQKFRPYPDVAAFWGSHLVQTWWRLTDLVTAKGRDDEARSADKEVGQDLRPPELDELKLIAAFNQCNDVNSAETAASDSSASEDPLVKFFNLKKLDVRPLVRSQQCGSLAAQEMTAQEKMHFKRWRSAWHFDVARVASGDKQDADGQAYSQAYSLDLIPRQSALNVAEAHSSSRAYGFAGLFGLISGLGGKARYEQQRDKYDQFVQQEAYASAFGKGQETFGWTFGPLPGTKRMAPGLRTTYAVLVVPSSTRVIRLEGIGCGYRRRRVPEDPFQFGDVQDSDEDCSRKVTYDLEVPNGADSFYVDAAYFKPVQAGQRITVELGGTFSAQVGVLINGTPLQKVVSLGQPLLEQTAFNVPPNAGDNGVQGVYELVGGKTILMSFLMPATFVGTPRIALITPAHASVINAFTIWVSDSEHFRIQSKIDCFAIDCLPKVSPMFYPGLAISRVTPVYDRATQATAGTSGRPSLLLQIFGQGFRSGASHTLLIDGHVLTEQLPPNPAVDLDLNEFRVLTNGLVQARIERSVYFPHYTADLLLGDPTQTLEATANYDDDGPPDLRTCTKSMTLDGATKTVRVVLTGDYFTPTFPPVSSNSNLVITSSSLTSPKEWTVVGTPGAMLDQAEVVLKGLNPLNSRTKVLSACTIVPAK
jgi:hypothetical protein